MYTMEEILARLRNGDKDEDIANEMANALNAAVDAYAKEAEKIQKEKELEAKKDELAQTFADVLFEYLRLDNPDAASALESPDSAKIAREVLDMSIMAFSEAFNMIDVQKEDKMGMEFSNENCDRKGCGPQSKPTGKSCPHNTSKSSAEVALDEFLALFGLK